MRGAELAGNNAVIGRRAVATIKHTRALEAPLLLFPSYSIPIQYSWWWWLADETRDERNSRGTAGFCAFRIRLPFIWRRRGETRPLKRYPRFHIYTHVAGDIARLLLRKCAALGRYVL